MGFKQILGPKHNLRFKMILVKKEFGNHHKFWAKKLGQEKFLGLKIDFGLKILGQKNWGQNYFGSK